MKIPGRLIITAEGLVGSSVQDIAGEMLRLAQHLSCGVQVNMNGVRLLAFPHTTVADLDREYRQGLEQRVQEG